MACLIQLMNGRSASRSRYRFILSSVSRFQAPVFSAGRLLLCPEESNIIPRNFPASSGSTKFSFSAHSMSRHCAIDMTRGRIGQELIWIASHGIHKERKLVSSYGNEPRTSSSPCRQSVDRHSRPPSDTSSFFDCFLLISFGPSYASCIDITTYLLRPDGSLRLSSAICA